MKTHTQLHLEAMLAVALQFLFDHFELDLFITGRSGLYTANRFTFSAVNKKNERVHFVVGMKSEQEMLVISSLYPLGENQTKMKSDFKDAMALILNESRRVCLVSPTSFVEQTTSLSGCAENHTSARASAHALPTLLITTPYAVERQELPPLPLTVKLLQAIQGEPQIISDADFDKMVPAFSAGWKLVTMPNPSRCGILDSLLLLRSDSPIARAFRIKHYGCDLEPVEIIDPEIAIQTPSCETA